jgi:probable HAF family extracellular repeat protein
VGERYGTNGAASYPSVALRWTVANGYELLGTMAGGVTSTATAANDDGSIISGNGDSTLGTNRAFRWVAGSGFEDLGTLSGGTSAYAARMSLDGGVIVGYGNTSAGVNHAFRWTSGGMDDLGVLPGMTESFATDVTGDGSAIVGYSGTSTADRRPFRWVGGVMEDLGLFPGSSRTSALGVSPDGATIVGSYYNGRERAFLWREGIGYQDLTEYANEQGLNLNSQFGPWLVQASDVSNGGRTFVGYQGGFSAQTWGYVMTVPVPEPLTLATVGLGVLLAGRRRRKRGLEPSALK